MKKLFRALVTSVAILCATGLKADAQIRNALSRAIADSLYVNVSSDAMAGLLTADAATGIAFPGSTSGTATIKAPAVAGTTAVTLPNATSTLPIFGQQIAFTGPTTARSYALKDADSTFAMTSDALIVFAATTSAQLRGVLSDESGSGVAYFQGGDLGTPSAGILTNATGLPVANIAGLGAGIATFLATPSSANLAGAITDETGTGAAVFADAPTLVNPVVNLGSGSAIGSISGNYEKMVSAAGVGNTAATTDDPLWTLTPLPANTLTVAADAVVFSLELRTGATANNKRIGITVGGTQVNTNNTSANAANFGARITVRHIDSTHVNVQIVCAGGAGCHGGSYNLVVADLTANTLTLVVTGASPTTGAAGDVLLMGGSATIKR